jgi:hypothetical protein
LAQARRGIIHRVGESGFINLKVTGSVLMDSTKVGNGISKYYRVRKT